MWTLAHNIFQHTYTHNTHTSNNIYTIQSILKVNNNNITIIQRKFGILFGCIAGLLMYINTLIAAFLYTVLGMYGDMYSILVAYVLYTTYSAYTNLYCMACACTLISVLIVHTIIHLYYCIHYVLCQVRLHALSLMVSSEWS